MTVFCCRQSIRLYFGGLTLLALTTESYTKSDTVC